MKLNLKKLSLITLVIFISLCVKAQKGVCLSMGLEKPLAPLSSVYNPTYSFNSNLFFLEDKRLFNLSIAYFSFKPKEDVFYYFVGDDDYGTTSYSNYNVISVSAGIAFKYSLLKKFDIYSGGDIGYYHASYDIDFYNSYPYSYYKDESESIVENKGVISPKIGFFYNINKSLKLNLQSKLNYFTTIGLGSKGNSNPSYDPITDQDLATWSNTLGVFYYF